MSNPTRFTTTTALLCALAATSTPAVAQQGERGPVTLHAGAMYAGLGQDTYEPVRSLAGQDAFTRVAGPGGRFEATVFLSHRLARGDAVGVHATLGTGLDDLGEVVLFGVSVDLGRAMLTAGLATASLEEGTTPLDDEVFRGEGERTLYAELTRERRWAGFVGLSFAIIR
jgi:hypothetical protein